MSLTCCQRLRKLKDRLLLVARSIIQFLCCKNGSLFVVKLHLDFVVREDFLALLEGSSILRHTYTGGIPSFLLQAQSCENRHYDGQNTFMRCLWQTNWKVWFFLSTYPGSRSAHVASPIPSSGPRNLAFKVWIDVPFSLHQPQILLSAINWNCVGQQVGTTSTFVTTQEFWSYREKIEAAWEHDTVPSPYKIRDWGFSIPFGQISHFAWTAWENNRMDRVDLNIKYCSDILLVISV